jgi:hypothetical protein
MLDLDVLLAQLKTGPGMLTAGCFVLLLFILLFLALVWWFQ